MEKKKLGYLNIQHFTFLVYFILTTIIFYLSICEGNEGVSIKLFGGGDDGYFYWEQAQNVADGKPWIRTSIYPLILGTLIKVTGIRNPYIIRLFNYIGFLLFVMFSLWLVNIQFKDENNKIKENYRYKSMTILLILYLFYGSLLMYVNLSIYRDIWIFSLYTLLMFLSIKFIFYKQNRVYYFVMWIFFLCLLGQFRMYAMFSSLLGVVLQIIYGRVKNSKKSKNLILLILTVFTIYYTLFMDLSVFGMSLGQALNYRTSGIENHSGGSQMWISLNQPNIILFLINYIHSYIGNLLAPLPWHIRGISTLFVFISETIPMFFILIFLYKKKTLLTKIQKYILLQGFLWIGIIGFTNDNIGTATRLRIIGWVLIFSVFVVNYYKDKYSKMLIKKEGINDKNIIYKK